MTSFLTWLFGSVTGGRKETKPDEEVVTTTNSETIADTDTKGSKTKVKQRTRKRNEEPTFSTRLSTPIEEIIEETLNEGKGDSQTSSQASGETVVKPQKKKETKRKEQSTANKNQKKQNSVSQNNQVSNTNGKNNSEDDIEHPFLLVKERSKKSKNKSLLQKQNSEGALTAVITRGIKNKKESLRPSIIDHYKIKEKRLSLTERDQSQDFVFVYKEQIDSKNIKESKKVTSKLSYASIVTNSVPLDFKFGEEEDRTALKYKQEEDISSSIEVLSQCSEATEAGPVASDCNETLVSTENHLDNITPGKNSCSKKDIDRVESSIEIIENFEEQKHGLYVNNSHFEENILHSVINQSEPQKDKHYYIENHFQNQICATFSDSNSKEDYSEKLNTHTLRNIVEQLVDGSESDFVADFLQQDLQLESSESESSLEKQFFDKPSHQSGNSFANTTGDSSKIVSNFLSSEIQQEVLTHTSELLPEIEEEVSADRDISQETTEPVVEEPFHANHTDIPTENGQEVDNSFERFLHIDNNSQSQGTQQFQTIDIEDSLKNQIQIEKSTFGAGNIIEFHGNGADTLEVHCQKINFEPELVQKVANSGVLELNKPKEIISDFKSKTEDSYLVQNSSTEQDFYNLVLNSEEQVAEKPFTVVESEIPVSNCNIENKSTSDIQHQVNSTHLVDFNPTSLQDSEKPIEAQIYSSAKDTDTQETVETKVQQLKHQVIGTSFAVETSEITATDTTNLEPNSLLEATKSSEADISQPEEGSPDLDMGQVRVLTLNDKEHQESTIYRIEKKCILQFRLGPSLFGRTIKLYCNYPRKSNGVLEEFNRNCYQLLNWCQDEGCRNADDTASFSQVVAELAGSFHYYFVYENENTEEMQGSGYFIVDPALKFGASEELPLDCIQCQTVLAKHLGPFSTWENKLRVAKESGYNVVHFTPIQELGASNSSYSISEQLKLNPAFNEGNGKGPTFEDIEKLTTKMRKQWKVLSVCDIVLNHTANESKWLKEHPEATYNCVNCPYMRPAYLLDAAFHCFSMDVKKGLYEDRGIPAEVSTEEHLSAIRYHFKMSVLEPLKIYELFTVDVNKYLEKFLTLARKTSPTSDAEKSSLPEVVIIQDPEFRRLNSTIDLDLALKKYNAYRLDCFDEESRVKKCAEDLKHQLDTLNEALIKEVDDDLNAAIENVIAGIRYFRVQPDGPKHREITISCPLVYRYFTDYGSPKSLNEHEEIMFSENGKFLMAHNGWVMNSNPLENFADVGTKVYIRRELIAWGDSVKLRFGNKPDDSPFLWAHMRKYVEQTVKIFDGVRLDNCHSTPIPVAEYLLDCARKVRPDLYVVAELFTNSDLTDNIFVNRLGITSLIREAMSAWDSHEEGRLVYRYGGIPVGSFHQPNVRPLTPMVAHALFLDLTHDNPSPVEKRSVFDLLPSTALVNMACCASGSNRGYDELVPHHIHVVDETRQYTEWCDDEIQTVGNVRYVNGKSGIIATKKALNDLHFKLGIEGYNQVYVDQMDPDIVAVTRHNPESHTSYVLVAFTAFSHPDANAGSYQRAIKPLRVEGVLDEIVLEASLSHIDVKTGGSKYTKFSNFTKDSKWINGLSEYQVSIKQHIQVNQSDTFEEVNSGTQNVFQLNFKNFHPGSIVVVRVSLPKDMRESVSKIRSIIDSLSVKKDTELSQVIGKMTLADLNRALYRCDQEERDEGHGFDVYNIPGFSPLVYCGLQGFVSVLSSIRPNNDLGHPFCANLRDGNWMIEYIWKRLKIDEGTKELGQWIEENIKYLHSIPRYLIPCYFDIIISSLFDKLLVQSYSLMSNFVKNGSTFVKGLSLGSLQFGGYIRSADLPTLSPNLAPPRPPTRKNKNGETVQACITLAAGLPHFSVGYMRNWGRDTFIALRGLFILTDRFEEARQHILGYAACLRHGLIPNLLDGGRNPRYNCRDALWWWLYCIKSYCEEAPNGLGVLSDLVSRIFPTDDSAPQAPGAVDQPLHDVIQEALKVHFQGLKFRERNAGRQIDEHMTDAGFNNQIGIHPETGFVFGGNQMNCGTWMDKMGSSDKANNRGKPATPRDGSAVELVGLSKAAISWLWKLNKEGKYPYDGVERTHKNGAVTKWTFKEWAGKIQDNFEKKFWIGQKPSEACKPELINKKNIYKDCFGSSQPWSDYQLRCNFPIAMVAAPEMFDPQHAWAALEQAEKYLLGPLGMKTLDPDDWNYRGDYDNSNDSDDFHTAHGFNYHQGPEWLWPVGFFLRAKLIFAAQNGMLKETLASTKVILSKHFTELQTSAWHGLPELTNSNGAYCRDSSRTQAWSMSSVLEVLDDLQRIESKQIIVN